MTYHVVLHGADGAKVEFNCEVGRSVAQAAANAGYELTTGCRQGRCAICRAWILEGKVRPIRRPSKNAVGTPAEREDGTVLLCAVGPDSDLVVGPLSPWVERERI